jgi:hypothetical protein
MRTLHLLPAAAPAIRPRSSALSTSTFRHGPWRRLLPVVTGFFGRAWRWIFGRTEASIGERRGYRQPVCAVCRIDVHDTGEVCPEQQVGDCDICGTVRLDYYGNCSPAGERWRNHYIAHRRTWADEMRQHRASNTPRHAQGAFQAFRARVQGIAVDRAGKIDLREPERVRERVLCGIHGRQVPHDGRCPKCGGYGEAINNLRSAPTRTAVMDEAQPVNRTS